MKYYVLDVNPEPWAVGDLGISRRGGKLRPYIGPNGQLVAYKEAVKEALRAQNPKMLEGHIRMSFFFWRNQATYESLETGRKQNRNRPDVTNMQKATEDACQGILFVNDRDVTHIQDSVLVQAGPGVHGAVIIGIEGDDGLNLLDKLGHVVMEQIRALNENKPPEGDNDWIRDTEAVF